MFFPLPTVFNGQGEVDSRVMDELVDWYIDSGVNALFVLGSFGQGPACRVDQRKDVAELVTRRVNGRVPVVVHVGAVDPYTSIELGQQARAIGADGIGLVGPYYYSDRNEWELAEHYKMVDAAVGLPILMYNNPAYSGYPTSPSFIAKLLESVPNIFGAKLAKGNLDEAQAYLGTLPKGFSIFVPVQNMVPGMLIGVSGTISPPMALTPRVGVELVNAIQAGDRAAALDVQLRIIEYLDKTRPLGKAYGRGVTPVGLRMLGFDVKQYPRWPVKEMTPGDQERLRGALEAVGALRAGALTTA
jgi:dihydrodipicolinate synthase/N-acetylneuraminate lyase